MYKYSQPKTGEDLKYGGDCMIRAVAHATGVDYEEVYKIMHSYGWRTRKHKYLNGAKKWEDHITLTLQQLGYQAIRVSCPAVKGQPRTYAPDVPKKGIYIIRVAKHVATIQDGVLLDTWNCSNKCVYFYWEIVKTGKQ